VMPCAAGARTAQKSCLTVNKDSFAVRAGRWIEEYSCKFT